MKISREWATPITIGAFGLMSVTGVLMFFHFDTGFNKVAHEWLSWVFVAGVMTHVIVNWVAFRRYFLSSKLGRTIIAASALTLAATFIPQLGGGRGLPPTALAMKAVTGAPISTVAPLAGRPITQVIDDLAKVGIRVPSAEASIDSVIGDDRELQSKAMDALFRRS